jgi:hypothetical protein
VKSSATLLLCDTMLQISALRFISRSSPYDIVVGTTHLVNGNTLMEELIQTSANPTSTL